MIRKFLKFLGLGFIALIVLGIITIMASESDNKKEKSSTGPQQEFQATAPSSKEETKKEKSPKNKRSISKDEFDQIQNGMTYDEIKNIIGSDGEVLSESGQAGEQFHTPMHKWGGEKGLGLMLALCSKKVNYKTQIGIK